MVTKRLVELMGAHRRGQHRRGGKRVLDRTDLAAPPQFAVDGGEAAHKPRRTCRAARGCAPCSASRTTRQPEAGRGLIARRPDFWLLTAVNGTLGIERARASQPEMILMDVNLPDIALSRR